MKLPGTTSSSSAAFTAIGLFLLTAELITANDDGSWWMSASIPVELPPTCLGDLASFASRSSSEIKGTNKYCNPDRFM